MKTRLPTSGAVIVVLFAVLLVVLFLGVTLSVMRPISGGW
jgi:hypothetical protein